MCALHSRFDSHFLVGGLDGEERLNCLRDLPIVLYVIYFCGLGQHLTSAGENQEHLMNRLRDTSAVVAVGYVTRNAELGSFLHFAQVCVCVCVCENACGLAMKFYEVYCMDFGMAAVCHFV